MKKKRRRTRRATDEELLPYMDYLHGDVVDNKFEVACFYEYATESAFLREAARLWAQKKYSCEKIVKGSVIWQCPSFPQKRWNQLSPRERANILLWFLPSQLQPLRVIDVWLLDGMGILDRLKTMAAEVMESKKLRKPHRKVYPIIEDPIFDARFHQRKVRVAWVHVLFTLDFGKTKKQLLQEFDQWLQLRENRARLDAHRQNPTGKTGAFKDRLKDLAAWRLYRELGCEDALAFAQKNRKRDKDGRLRPFYNAGREQSKKIPPNQAPLYSEESGFPKAKARALAYGMELIPWAFGKSAEDADRLQNEAPKDRRNARKQARKISKSSF